LERKQAAEEAKLLAEKKAEAAKMEPELERQRQAMKLVKNAERNSTNRDAQAYQAVPDSPGDDAAIYGDEEDEAIEFEATASRALLTPQLKPRQPRTVPTRYNRNAWVPDDVEPLPKGLTSLSPISPSNVDTPQTPYTEGTEATPHPVVIEYYDNLSDTIEDQFQNDTNMEGLPEWATHDVNADYQFDDQGDDEKDENAPQQPAEPEPEDDDSI